jgi:agmatinase
MYEEVRDLIRAVCGKGRLVGFDVSEVSPPYDHVNQTALYAAQLILDAICFYTKQQARGRG